MYLNKCVYKLPTAEGGNNSDGFTVTLNGLADCPPDKTSSTGRKPALSDPVYCALEKLTVKTMQ